MYFEIEDRKPDISRLGGPLTWRDGVFLSIIVHLLGVIAILLGPRLLPESWLQAKRPVRLVEQPQQEEPMRFVFVEPKVDLRALKPPERADASDMDREARTRERSPNPENSMPVLRGNTPERVEQQLPDAAPGRGPGAEPAPDTPPAPPEPPQPESTIARANDMPSPFQAPPPAQTPTPRRPLGGGSLGDALRNLDRYVERSQFDNAQGGGTFGPAIQFDTKGVEFGPWVRRFIAQVRRNWEPLIPLAAMTMKGHVVVTFNVHKDGSLTDINVVGPCPIDSFNTAAYGALASSNPTAALPPEYPADKAFFTVTFFYNENPQ